jgi:1,4-dihydroxy-2-naphthoate octaprenyltransferase
LWFTRQVNSTSPLKLWIQGARPRTLPAAVVPVVVGTAAAANADLGWDRGIIWWRLAMALVVALALQVATNYANDYSDGIRGTDDARVGPLRLVGSGLVRPKAVRNAALLAFGVAGVAGLTLALAVGPELLIVGAASIAAGWFYTGGSHPYGYIGLGEVFVFVFFGLVATAGSTYVQVEELTWVAIALGCGVGALACALLVTNNLRDIPTDAASGKRTLAVRLGDGRTRMLYLGLLVLAFVALLVVAIERPWVLLGLLAAPLAVPPLRMVMGGATGPGLIPVLAATGRLQLGYGLLTAVGLWIA